MRSVSPRWTAARVRPHRRLAQAVVPLRRLASCAVKRWLQQCASNPCALASERIVTPSTCHQGARGTWLLQYHATRRLSEEIRFACSLARREVQGRRLVPTASSASTRIRQGGRWGRDAAHQFPSGRPHRPVPVRALGGARASSVGVIRRHRGSRF